MDKKLFNLSLNKKRIIAREFLIIFACCIIPIVTFLSVTLYGYLHEKEINKQLNYSVSVIHKFRNSTKGKQREAFFLKHAKNFGYYNSATSEYDNLEFWNRLIYLMNVDSINYKWEHDWRKEIILFNQSNGFNTPEEFKNFILKNSPTPTEGKEFNKAMKMRTNLSSELEDRYNSADRDNKRFILQILLISFIVLFPLRYIIYAIKWSFKILRLK